jgi:hypothetical protein
MRARSWALVPGIIIMLDHRFERQSQASVLTTPAARAIGLFLLLKCVESLLGPTVSGGAVRRQFTS